jgi:4-hydroxy-4-methyl-2-oxoglutarate aldolase
MAITLRKFPPVLETWFLDEARSIPTAYMPIASRSIGYLGGRIRWLVGTKIMAGWALPVSCPTGDTLATFLALQHVMDNIGSGRWVIVVAQDEPAAAGDVAMWSYLQSAMGWEVGVVGAVVNGFVRDIVETQEKLGKEFGVFGWGGSPMPAVWTPNGTIGEPVSINGVTIRAGDLIVGDNDGVVCIPKDEVEQTIELCRQEIVNEVNRLAHVREGKGAVEVLELEKMLKGNVDLEE